MQRREETMQAEVMQAGMQAGTQGVMLVEEMTEEGVEHAQNPSIPPQHPLSCACSVSLRSSHMPAVQPIVSQMTLSSTLACTMQRYMRDIFSHDGGAPLNVREYFEFDRGQHRAAREAKANSLKREKGLKSHHVEENSCTICWWACSRGLLRLR